MTGFGCAVSVGLYDGDQRDKDALGDPKNVILNGAQAEHGRPAMTEMAAICKLQILATPLLCRTPLSALITYTNICSMA